MGNSCNVNCQVGSCCQAISKWCSNVWNDHKLKLRILLDMNKTLKASDVHDKTSAEVSALEIIARNTFGHCDPTTDIFVLNNTVATIFQENGCTSWYADIKNRHPVRYKDVVANLFSSREWAALPSAMRAELQLKYFPPLLNAVQSKIVFPSATKLVDGYQHVGAIFGICTLNMQEIQKVPKDFPQFSGRCVPVTMKRTSPDDFTVEDEKTNKIGKTTFTKIQLEQPKTVYVCLGDYNYWKDHDENDWAGKMTVGSEDCITVIFDDMPFWTWIGPNVFFHRVNTCQAATDDEYFLKLMEPHLRELQRRNAWWRVLGRISFTLFQLCLCCECDDE